MHIRPAIEKDVPQIKVLLFQLFRIHQEFDREYYSFEEKADCYLEDWIKQQLNFSQQFIFVAEDDSSKNTTVTGFISGYVKYLFPWFKEKKVGHISFLAVDDKYRKRGVGRLLENQAKDWFKEKNIKYIELYVNENNTIAVNAWKEYGFQNFYRFLRKKI